MNQLQTTGKEEDPPMQAKDVMTVNVISVSGDSPINEVVHLMLKYRISAVPVIDGARKVVGIISESDLLRPEGANRSGTQRAWWLQTVFTGQKLDYEQAHGRTARQGNDAKCVHRGRGNAS